MNLAIIAVAAIALGWVAICVRVDARERKIEERRISWRALTGHWLWKQAKEEKLMLVFMADSRKQGEHVHLVSFGCNVCGIRFWTEVGELLAPKCCPYCGVEFTRIQKVKNDLCKAN